MDHLQGIVGWGGQTNAVDRVILWLFAVAVSTDENLHGASDTAVFPEFFGGAGDIERDGRPQVLYGGNRLSERSRGLDTVSGRMASVQRNAKLPPELPNGSLDLDAETLSQAFWVSVAQLNHGGNPQCMQFFADFTADAPDVANRPELKMVRLFLDGKLV